VTVHGALASLKKPQEQTRNLAAKEVRRFRYHIRKHPREVPALRSIICVHHSLIHIIERITL